MTFLRVLEILIGVLFLWLLLTQLLIPYYKGRKLFPLFRKKERELEEQLVEAHEIAAEIERQRVATRIYDDAIANRKPRPAKRRKPSKGKY